MGALAQRGLVSDENAVEHILSMSLLSHKRLSTQMARSRALAIAGPRGMQELTQLAATTSSPIELRTHALRWMAYIEDTTAYEQLANFIQTSIDPLVVSTAISSPVVADRRNGGEEADRNTGRPRTTQRCNPEALGRPNRY